MDPIKVDFSDSGKKKSVKDVLIPPEKAGLKIVINIVVMLITAVVAYYFMLPPMNLQSYDFYIYWAVVLASYVISAFITSGAFAKPEYVPYVKRQATVPVIIAIVLGLIVGVGYLISSPFFRAKDYSEILTIENADFDDTISVIDSISDFDKVPLIDKDAARALADKTIGDFSALGLESQFEILENDSTQINYKGSPYRVYPLQYGDIFKWFTNSVAGENYEGIPGYVRVNLNTQEAQLITDFDIKYSTAEHFGEYLERHLRFKYPTYIFGDTSFEIDDSGKPYWVVEHIKKTVGLVGGDDVVGVILIDAVSGDDVYYTAEEIGADNSEIAWIDQAYDADLLVQQYNYLGKYAGGFWNSIIGQSGVKQASQGYSFIAVGDDVYLYTGVTSVTSDDSILGFFFINQRTKEGFFYNTTGATEAAAQQSAQGKVSDKGWKAAFPILLNIDGEATYFMALKDNANIVKSYAMVNVQQYNVVAIPTEENADLASAVSEYIKGLKALSPSVIIDINFDVSGNKPSTGEDTPDSGLAQITGTVTDIRTTVVSGNTYFYIELDNSGVYYYVAADVADMVVLFNVGDTITVTIDEASEGQLVEALQMVMGTVTLPEEDVNEPVEETTEAVEETTAA
ncbi:MAG: CvpA family protein [Ruminococcaceae bacterium]|nr:CvpA family protein [Oscillospiraceae bacterium]